MHAFKKRERTAKNIFEFLWTESDLFEKISANVSSFGTISEWLFSEIWQWDCCKGGLLALISSWVDWWINVLRADGAGSWTIKSVLEISIELFCWECLFNFIDCRWGGIQSEMKVGWVDVSLSEGWITIWLFWWLSMAFVRIWGLEFGLTHLGLALLGKDLCERLSEPFFGFFSFFHRLKKMSATFIVVASKHAVGTKLRNSLVDDFLPFSSCTHS